MRVHLLGVVLVSVCMVLVGCVCCPCPTPTPPAPPGACPPGALRIHGTIESLQLAAGLQELHETRFAGLPCGPRRLNRNGDAFYPCFVFDGVRFEGFTMRCRQRVMQSIRRGTGGRITIRPRAGTRHFGLTLEPSFSCATPGGFVVTVRSGANTCIHDVPAPSSPGPCGQFVGLETSAPIEWITVERQFTGARTGAVIQSFATPHVGEARTCP